MRNIVIASAVLAAALSCACGQARADSEAAPNWEYAELGSFDSHPHYGRSEYERWWWHEGFRNTVEAKSMEALAKALGVEDVVPHPTAIVNSQAAKGWELVAVDGIPVDIQKDVGQHDLRRWVFRRRRA